MNKPRKSSFAIMDEDGKYKFYSQYFCPKCGTIIADFYQHQKFCHECGEQIDWSDEE